MKMGSPELRSERNACISGEPLMPARAPPGNLPASVPFELRSDDAIFILDYLRELGIRRLLFTRSGEPQRKRPRI